MITFNHKLKYNSNNIKYCIPDNCQSEGQCETCQNRICIVQKSVFDSHISKINDSISFEYHINNKIENTGKYEILEIIDDNNINEIDFSELHSTQTLKNIDFNKLYIGFNNEDDFEEFDEYTDELHTSTEELLQTRRNHFIERIKEKYLECDFDFSDMTFVNMKTNVTIFCNKHQIYFTTKPDNMLSKTCGCPECRKEINEKTKEEDRQKREKEFIQWVNENYPEYDCSKVHYIDNITDVKLFCNIHNIYFNILPASLKQRKTYCPECTSEKYRQKREKEFIQWVNENYPEYDCSNVKYIDTITPVILHCNIHNIDFEVTPDSLKQKQSYCPECGINNYKILRSQRFIQWVNENYLEYDCSKVEYIDNSTPVILHCNIHNIDFEITPDSLKQKHSYCPECKNNNIIIKQKQERKEKQEKFIKDSIELWGPDTFDYSLVNYIDKGNKITLICKKHNQIFEQYTYTHLNKQYGCPICQEENRKIRYENERVLNEENFYKQAKEIHKDRYSYDKVKYIDARKTVDIYCKKHKCYFKQTPSSHLSGSGCPFCNHSKLEDIVKQILDDNDIIYETQKSFEWLKFKHKQRLDFYLPDYNIAIECQGEQHYKPVYFGKHKIDEHKKSLIDEQFELNKQRDENKKRLCSEHNIPIIYIANKKYCDNVEIFEISKLIEIINKYK